MVRRGSGLVTMRRQCARPASEDDTGIRAALDALAMRAVETIDGADHAGVTLVQGRAIKCLAATDVHPLLLTNLQRRHRQGPCLDLTAEHRLIRVDDLGVESRWPDFGAHAVASTPVRSLLAQRVVPTGDAYAVFTLYADRPGVFDSRTAVDSASFVSQMARLLAVEAVAQQVLGGFDAPDAGHVGRHERQG